LIVYPDTSLLLPLYLMDGRTHQAQQRMVQRPVVLFTPFHRAELTNAIYQQVFRGQISTFEARIATSNFDLDCKNGILQMVDLPERLFSDCAQMAERRVATLGVRTLDTLHVATALELKADRFWTFDPRQARLA
jgi:predicted nucleic acid-binding protein